ncbi:CoA pyrophosphatase [Aliidiomarina soli]|uniref:CoA pyrophosphatase n=2 Tax=Aliidiomarina soli TaxID=1928574 RepID=A0A432WH63_9GAMM|nr:CoA pyrophosphatase [Aliidiomarina soli]
MMIKTREQFIRQFNLGRPSPTRFVKELPIHYELRPSAVLIALVEQPQGIEVVLTKRTDNLRHHAGQICFPGGRQDADDGSLQVTALREFEEELGVHRDQVEIIGQLPDMPVISRFMIRPYVGFLKSLPQWHPAPAEVEEVFTVPLHQLLSHQLHYAYQLPRFGVQRVWFIPWRERMIWGATAAIVRSLSEQLLPTTQKLYRPLN